MDLDPRRPVIVGVAQIKQRPDDPADAAEAIQLMVDAVSAAAADAGAPGLLAKLDHIGVVDGAWKYTDPARIIAERVGAATARTSLSAGGGNTPQAYINDLGSRIQAGELDTAVVAGAEIIWSRRRQRRAGLTVEWTVQEGVEPDEHFGNNVPMSTDFENSRGMEAPINFYPVFESAIRASNGETIDEHRDRLSGLWEGFNRVAVANDYAWFREPMTAEEIRNPSAGNRMVGFPYTKAMNSNWDLDLSAAILICSVAAAEAAGVPRDRWVFPLAGADAHDTYSVSERRDLHSSPAITEAGRALFDTTGTGPDDVAHIDVYSCFPSAVQVGAASLGFGLDRPLTLTGGLTFAGGPLNNYVSHSIATMIRTLREDPGVKGVITANGGYLTKHSLGMYSTEPADHAYRTTDVQEAVDAVPRTPVNEGYAGAVTVEAYTVMHSADGPEEGLCAVRNAAGERTWGRVTDRGTLAEMVSTEAIGRSGELDPEGALALG
ncbi:MAG: acetyl-CoA acetyltransferase [Actinomycetota bacterium]